MKVDKRIVIMEEIEVKFTGITLLSEEEYLNNKNFIPPVNAWWWLRSPGDHPHSAALVYTDGLLYSFSVTNGFGCVRPALRIWNPQSSNLSRGDKFVLNEYMWTVLSDDLALCDDIVGITCFRNNWMSDETNDYDKSDIKQWLYKWAERQRIEFMMQTFSPD